MKKVIVFLVALSAVSAFVSAADAPKPSYYVYILKLVRKDTMKTGFTDAEKPIMAAHAAYHAKLTKDGVEVVAGPTLEDDPIGLTIFSAASAEEATAVMNNDPAVKGGLMTATLHPFAFAFGTAKPK